MYYLYSCGSTGLAQGHMISNNSVYTVTSCGEFPQTAALACCSVCLDTQSLARVLTIELHVLQAQQ